MKQEERRGTLVESGDWDKNGKFAFRNCAKSSVTILPSVLKTLQTKENVTGMQRTLLKEAYANDSDVELKEALVETHWV